MASTNPTPVKSFYVISPRLLRPLVIGCLALAAWLVPKRAELIKRLLEDGHHQRAIEVAEEGRTLIDGHPVTILKALPLNEAEEPTATAAPSPLDRLRAALLPEAKAAGADLTQAVQQVNDPVSVLEVIHKLDPQLDAVQRGKVYLGMGQSALAMGNPGLAADILAEGAARGVHSPALLVREVTAYRWSGRPQLALAALEAWQAQEALPVGLRDLPFQLYREMNRPDKALDLLLAGNSKELTAEQMTLACELGNQAGQMPRVLPLLQQYLSTQPAGRATVAELANHQVTADAAWQSFAKRCALSLEWGGQPLAAFRLHQKLAVLGERDSLQRMLALNPGLNLDGEVLPVLQAVVPVEEQPSLTLTLAQMEADAGEYEVADRHFAQWLERHPHDLAALKQRAAVAEEQSRLEDATKLYEQALALAPQDVSIQKELADLHIARRDFRDAFVLYEKLPESAHDNLTLENYALLAESLAEYPAYNRALVARMHRLKQPSTQDFLELGRSYAVIGEEEAQVKTYETGLRRIPRSHILRIELAHSLRLMDRYQEALAVLARPEMKSDMQAMQLYIELACLAEDYVGALSFVGQGIEKQFAFGPEVRLDLGEIYLNNGYAREADAMFSSVPDEPALWPLLAAARFKAGNFASAETYQRKYLAGLTVPDPQGWMLLGDICKAEGRESEAQEAYAKSLSLMTDKLDDDQPSNAPDQPTAGSQPTALRSRIP
jgi:Flp pilus assembly protein TadD